MFERSESFFKRGNGFAVEIKHFIRIGFIDSAVREVHGWYVYVIIYTNNGLFKKLSRKRQCDFNAGDKVYSNFHGGCTCFLKEKTYIRIGCDFCHYGDDTEKHSSVMTDSVWNQAVDLYNFMERL